MLSVGFLFVHVASSFFGILEDDDADAAVVLLPARTELLCGALKNAESVALVIVSGVVDGGCVGGFVGGCVGVDVGVLFICLAKMFWCMHF